MDDLDHDRRTKERYTPGDDSSLPTNDSPVSVLSTSSASFLPPPRSSSCSSLPTSSSYDSIWAMDAPLTPFKATPSPSPSPSPSQSGTPPPLDDPLAATGPSNNSNTDPRFAVYKVSRCDADGSDTSYIYTFSPHIHIPRGSLSGSSSSSISAPNSEPPSPRGTNVYHQDNIKSLSPSPAWRMNSNGGPPSPILTRARSGSSPTTPRGLFFPNLVSPRNSSGTVTPNQGLFSSSSTPTSSPPHISSPSSSSDSAINETPSSPPIDYEKPSPQDGTPADQQSDSLSPPPTRSSPSTEPASLIAGDRPASAPLPRETRPRRDRKESKHMAYKKGGLQHHGLPQQGGVPHTRARTPLLPSGPPGPLLSNTPLLHGTPPFVVWPSGTPWHYPMNAPLLASPPPPHMMGHHQHQHPLPPYPVGVPNGKSRRADRHRSQPPPTHPSSTTHPASRDRARTQPVVQSHSVSAPSSHHGHPILPTPIHSSATSGPILPTPMSSSLTSPTSSSTPLIAPLSNLPPPSAPLITSPPSSSSSSSSIIPPPANVTPRRGRSHASAQPPLLMHPPPPLAIPPSAAAGAHVRPHPHPQQTVAVPPPSPDRGGTALLRAPPIAVAPPAGGAGFLTSPPMAAHPSTHHHHHQQHQHHPNNVIAPHLQQDGYVSEVQRKISLLELASGGRDFTPPSRSRTNSQRTPTVTTAALLPPPTPASTSSIIMPQPSPSAVPPISLPVPMPLPMPLPMPTHSPQASSSNPTVIAFLKVRFA
eukprot:TRINITY_DN8701_c0_g1_i3.p1 TRINITY_DN8701_c0_g1~~TRINITY_DN8701_c0_g1_i3.p1  ORF type:complete len:818 (+),score=219.65 TRINITY_DN8701_c0_g1_i3:186-2456(+)